MRDRTKASFSNSKNESIYNNCEVKKMQTRRKQNKRKPMDEKK